MTNYEEEQELEIEALQSIFTEGEFQSVSSTEFKLKLRPFAAGESGENHVGITLRVAYTPDYPETAPDWDLLDIVGLSDDKLEVLRNHVSDTVNSSLGMAMIYTVAEACRDWLKENNVKALSMHEEMMQRLGGGEAGGENDDEEEDEDDDDDDEEGEEEWKGLADKALVPAEQRITAADFQTWRQKFEEEMYSTGVWARIEAKGKTGKQIFCDAQGKEEGGASPTDDASTPKPKENVPYNAALFGEDEDDDLDDLSDGGEG